jgi:hypothetical protein
MAIRAMKVEDKGDGQFRLSQVQDLWSALFDIGCLLHIRQRRNNMHVISDCRVSRI